MAWDGAPTIETICVGTDAIFEGQSLSVQQVLGFLGIEGDLQLLVIVPVGGDCDATLDISFTGTALSGTYGTRTLYTGFEVAGSLMLSAPERPRLVYPFELRSGPADRYYDAPYHEPPVDPIDALGETSWSLILEMQRALEAWMGPVDRAGEICSTLGASTFDAGGRPMICKEAENCAPIHEGPCYRWSQA